MQAFQVKKVPRVLLVISASLALLLPAAGCDDGTKPSTSTNPYDSIPNYGQAIEKAQDAAAQAQKRAQESEDMLKQVERGQ